MSVSIIAFLIQNYIQIEFCMHMHAFKKCRVHSRRLLQRSLDKFPFAIINYMKLLIIVVILAVGLLRKHCITRDPLIIGHISQSYAKERGTEFEWQVCPQPQDREREERERKLGTSRHVIKDHCSPAYVRAWRYVRNRIDTSSWEMPKW